MSESRAPGLRALALAIGLWLYLAAGVGAAACASTPASEVLPPEEEYRSGLDAYQRERWGDAAEHFNRLVLNYPDSEHVVEARYLLGRANFELEEYPSAAQDFERFQQDFPTDSLADDALYWAGRAYEAESLKPQLDQGDTQRAISSYTELLRQYPGTPHAAEAGERIASLRERLAEKAFLNAEYYFKQERWTATEIYARHLIEEYPQSRYVAPAYLILARAYAALGRGEDARRIQETLLEQFPDSPEADDVRRELGGPALSVQSGPRR